MKINQNSFDPLDIMNSVMKFEEDDFSYFEPRKRVINQEALERRIAALCEIIVEKNKRIAELEKDSRLLSALHAGGVDNWGYYWESIKDHYPEYLQDEDEE